MPPKNDKPVIGIDLGGTNMQIGLVSPDNKLLGSAKRKTKAEEGKDAIFERMLDGIAECCLAAGKTPKDIGGIGIGAPGAVDPDKGVVLEAVNLRWNDLPVAAQLGKKAGVPVFLDNDVNVAILGEHELGAAKGHDDVLGVWLGTGIGGGLILNGKLYYGHFLTAGEIGHTILFPNNPIGTRSLEHNCSRSAVVDRIVRLMKGNRKSSIGAMVDGDFDKIKSKTVAKAFEQGDELVTEVVNETAHLLGVAIAGVVTLMSLPCVVLGGGLTEALGKPFVEKVEKKVRQFAFPEVCKQVVVLPSKLEDNAGVFGAAVIARDRLG